MVDWKNLGNGMRYQILNGVVRIQYFNPDTKSYQTMTILSKDLTKLNQAVRAKR